MENSLMHLGILLNDLRNAGLLEFEFVNPQMAGRINPKEVKKAISAFASRLESTLDEKPLEKDCIQIKAANRDILTKRIDAFLQRKHEERQKLTHDVPEGHSSRTLPYKYRRINVENTCNEVGPTADATKPQFLSRDESVGNRISTIETQLGLETGAKADFLLRMKTIEDRLLYLESVTPEYQNIK